MPPLVHACGIVAMLPRPMPQLVTEFRLTLPPHVMPEAVPHVHAVQLRVSAYDAYDTCLFGKLDGHARSPDAYTHIVPPKGAVGFGAQSRPAPHPPSMSVPSHALSALIQLAAVVV